ncbi:MAG: Transcriptional regulatory protein OmpR [Alphaproteobacteria bacterium MarineAlpha4_Bin2]|nr:MAG: Transcriptional regulatory protein OmpR [Alphaproteobacteria bacterium MarineAlpha4_Bin2]
MLSDDTPHILVIDDDRRLRQLLRKYLSDNGFRVTAAANALEARRRMDGLCFDLLVLDRMMPDEDGLDFAKWLRPFSEVPILMLTAMGEVGARIDGLEAGVDDYLSKPFEPRELLLRIRTILRRAEAGITVAISARIRLGRAEYDPQRGYLAINGNPIRLTGAEASLLSALSAEPGTVLSRYELTRRCAIEGGERAIDVQVTRLRRKIEPDPRMPQYLQTVRGRGYVLRPD